MKRIVTLSLAGLLVLVAVAAFAEDSPSRNTVKLAPVPRACLDKTTRDTSGVCEDKAFKYFTSWKDESVVWHDASGGTYQKVIYTASREPLPTTVTRVALGLVVKQDTITTGYKKVPVDDELNETAYVEERAGYKYRYAK